MTLVRTSLHLPRLGHRYLVHVVYLLGEEVGIVELQVGHVGLLHEEHRYLTELLVGTLNDGEGCVHEGTYGVLYLLYLQFDASATDDIVAATSHTEPSAVGVHLHDIVGMQQTVVYQWCINDETSV